MMVRVLGLTCLSLVSASILSAAGMLAWFAADRAIPVEVLSSEVLTPRVRPGDKLVVRQRVRYLRNCSAHVDRLLLDSHTHREFLRDIDYEYPPLGLGIRTITFEEEVPANFGPGLGEYRAAPSYACNPLQKYYWPISRPETVLGFQIADDVRQASP
ncbi:hypothetical protein ABC766_27345 [Methylobacterium fujisawaense]|uniref:hypothetical protein n=1 Tax=Methylobacterium fujisawaense TaxID=107400 RepID=UPI0031F5AA1B